MQKKSQKIKKNIKMGKFSNFLSSRKYKRIMGVAYGLGASIVIIGALFKLTHWQGANLMLTVGLLTEAVIFFLSAFEPPHVEPDWSLVYPEFKMAYHGVESNEKSAPRTQNTTTNNTTTNNTATNNTTNNNTIITITGSNKTISTTIGNLINGNNLQFNK